MNEENVKSTIVVLNLYRGLAGAAIDAGGLPSVGEVAKVVGLESAREVGNLCATTIGEAAVKDFMRSYTVKRTPEVIIGLNALVTGQATPELMKSFGKAAGKQATVHTVASTASKATGGAVVSSVVDCVALALDGEDHTAAEYVTTAGIGAASAVAGAMATSAATAAMGAAFGSVVPGVGTVIGWGIGLAVGTMLRQAAKG